MASVNGYTKDVAGNLLTSAVCNLFKDNLDGTCSFIQQVVSDAITAAYHFDAAVDSLPQYFVVAWKDDSPHVFDCTDHVLQPIADSGSFSSVGTAITDMFGVGAGVGGTGDFFSSGVSTAEFIAQSGSVVFMDGTGDMQFVGGPRASGDLSIVGTGDLQFVGLTSAFTAMSMVGVGDEQMRGQGDAPMSIAGTGVLTMVGGGGSVQLATDDFDRADGNDLGANWTPSQSFFDILTGEAITHTIGDDTCERYTGVSSPNDQYSEVVLGGAVGADGAGTGYGPGCRWATDGSSNGYRLVVNGSGWELVRFVAGITTSLSGGITSTTFAPGDTVRLTFIGTAWTVSKNGSTVTSGTGTDVVFSSGQFAICYSSTASELNNGIETWSGGSA